MINVIQPSIGNIELFAVKKLFESNWVGKGKVTDAFEAMFAKHLGVSPKHVMSISNCTQGLFTAMKLCGVQHGDEVVMPSISFVGAANAVMSVGATPVFCDVHRNHLNPSLDDIDARATPKTKAVIIMHYGGPLAIHSV